MDELKEILEKGIRAKRMGNYDLALEYYEKAREIAPFDSRIFNNMFRVYIGLEQYDIALRNLLIICCYNRIDRLIETDIKNNPMTELVLYQFRDKFTSPTLLYTEGSSNIVTYEPNLIFKAIEYDFLLNDFIFRAATLTWYIGHSYVGLYPTIISTHNIPINGFKNLNDSLLGKPAGNDLRENELAGLFLCIGFIFAHMNIKSNLITKESIVSYYLNTNNKLNFEISKYKEFLQQKF